MAGVQKALLEQLPPMLIEGNLISIRFVKLYKLLLTGLIF